MKTRNKLLAITLAALLAGGASLAAQVDEEPEPPDLSDLIEQFRAGQEQRVQERRELAQSMKDSTEEKRGQAMRALIEEQAAEQRALGQQIRERMKERAAEKRDAAGNDMTEDAPLATVSGLADDVQSLNEEFRQTRDQLLEEWRNKSAEERQATLEAFREDLEDLRTQRREVRDAARQRAEERRNRNKE